MTLVTPTMEETPTRESVAPSMEELLATGLTSPGSGAHDEGDPIDASGGEEAWTIVRSSGGPVRAGSEAMGDALSSPAKGPSMVIEQASPAAASVA